MPVPSADEFEAAGLYDPSDESTPERLQLLTWLAELGFTVAEMQEAFATGANGSIAGDRRLVPGERLDRATAIARSGLTPDAFDAYSTAFGFEPIPGAPDGGVGYTESEVDLFASVELLTSMFSRDEAIALVRVMGSSLARMGEAAVSLFLLDVESPHLVGGGGEYELSRRVYEAIELVDGLAERLDPLLRRHILQAIRRIRTTIIDDTERFQYRYAVGFVDLVGFTSLSGHLTAQQLAEFVGRFEARAHDVVSAAGARVVKLIGDEVMFVATEPSAACRAGRALIDTFAEDDDAVLPRGGIAYGNVVLRGGDYYGTIVNLASRLADAAVPGELLVSDPLAHAASECEFEPAGRRMIKGFDDPIAVHSMLTG